MDKKELENLLDLDFNKYEYYTYYLAYRYSKNDGKTEYFGRDSMNWVKSDIDIRARYVNPIEYDVDEFDEKHKEQFVDFVMEYINR